MSYFDEKHAIEREERKAKALESIADSLDRIQLYLKRISEKS
jgi:hypothetical protein